MRSLVLKHPSFGGSPHYVEFFEDGTYTRSWGAGGEWRLTADDNFEWREKGNHMWDGSYDPSNGGAESTVEYIRQQLVHWTKSIDFHDALETKLLS